jgi:glycosyltransferase involved in cell wall biosynthesis
MPVERHGGTAGRAIESVLSQQAPFPFELIVVSAEQLPLQAGVRNVVEPNRNPATRRNRGVSAAAGEILAFIDDDAFADPDWLATAVGYLEAHEAVLALGGPDPAPADATVAELFSETVLSTPLIGSGVAAHENRRGTFAVTRPSDVALVNLFVRRSAFTAFDESIGYIGEDTALVADLMTRGMVVYHDGVRVRHRRRPFPLQYLRQRWRYRTKTGRMLAEGHYRDEARIRAFLLAGVLLLVFPPLVVPYAIATFFLGARSTRLPPRYWIFIPAAFAAHHLTYFLAILWGFIRAKLRV